MIFTTDDKSAIEGKDLLVMAVASSYTKVRHTASARWWQGTEDRQCLQRNRGAYPDDPAQIIEDGIPQAQVAVLSGPTHAEEVSRGIPTQS